MAVGEGEGRIAVVILRHPVDLGKLLARGGRHHRDGDRVGVILALLPKTTTAASEALRPVPPLAVSVTGAKPGSVLSTRTVPLKTSFMLSATVSVRRKDAPVFPSARSCL